MKNEELNSSLPCGDLHDLKRLE